MKFAVVLAVLSSLSAVFAANYKAPPPTFEAKQYTVWNNLKRAGSSRRAEIGIDFKAEDGSDDFVHMYRLDLVGSAYERGYGHGFLLSKEIVEFTGPKLNQWYRYMVSNIDLNSFPEPMQSVLKALKALGMVAAPTLFNTAMAWVWEQEKQYVPSHYLDEIKGMAAGICDSLKTPNCDPAEWEATIQSFNMLPELVRMACTAFGELFSFFDDFLTYLILNCLSI
jgi:hypothetical protein